MAVTKVDGWEFAVEEAGTGPVVFLLHGLLFDRSMFDDQAAVLSSEYRVIRVDAPGHGDSPPHPTPFTLEDEVDGLAKLADTLGASGPVVWGGLSMGGMKSMRMALRHPDRVRGLILIECQPYPENTDLRAQYDALFQIVEESGPNEDIAGISVQVMFATANAASAVAARWKQEWLKMDASRLKGSWRSVMDRGDIGDRMGEIEAPAVVIHGVDDTPISIDIAREYVTKIAGAELVEIADAGHSSSVERPAEVTAAIQTFLKRLG